SGRLYFEAGLPMLLDSQIRVVESDGRAVPPAQLHAADAATLRAHVGRLGTIEGVVVGLTQSDQEQYLLLYTEASLLVNVYIASSRSDQFQLERFQPGERVRVT